ncbi:MAG: polysaccharide export protein, partial [Muribaculaceae bacterium]|nr:polysaccharide export protein [Muribaculaceae bacterium]
VNSPANPIVSSTYNLPQSNPAHVKDGASIQTTPQNQTFVVNSQGNIDFPELGVIHVAGLTTEQLKEKLTQEISKTVKDPIVLVRILNFTFDVAGEVKDPGTYPVNRQRFTILDALSAAGDLTEYGERNNVLLIREENGKRVHHRLDLTSADLLTSPYFYVRQNDYIYVEPNQIRKDNSKYNQNNAFKLSVVTTIVSGVSVIASLIIALAIK